LILSLLSGLAQPSVWGSVLKVRPGQNLTLFCDCSLDIGTLIIWQRNCSHSNQPSLVLNVKKSYSPRTSENPMSPLPRFQFVKNQSSNSYDLQITNVTESDEGLYFCGTERRKLEKINNTISSTERGSGGLVPQLLPRAPANVGFETTDQVPAPFTQRPCELDDPFASISVCEERLVQFLRSVHQ
uniref:Ig-like domain-containing protein n=1 Tax=Periophthalmus magnuspinnatus TaxID=409849 RepID=A0A3B4BFZ7_9GOBI